MYHQQMAVAIKSANKKVLREHGDTVYLPFGQEFSILVKNLNSVRALVSISIDGKDIADGTKFIIEPNKSIDIERFVRDGNMNAGNRFKFIERTANIENHRGVGVEDGLIRVEFWFEKIYPNYTNNGSWLLDNTVYTTIGSYPKGITRSYSANNSDSQAVYSSNVTNCATSSDSLSVGETHSLNDTGITVEGSISEQQFRQGAWFATESQSHVIVLKMLGETATNKVKKAVTVDLKPKCKTCGKVNKNSAKFCGECGTSLQIV